MQFARHLRNGVRSGQITCTIRIWQSPRVKVGGHYKLEGGAVVVESIDPIALADITLALSQESGFATVDELLATAHHGSGEQVYLIRFHFQPN